MRKNVAIRTLLLAALLHCSLSAVVQAMSGHLVTEDDPLAKSVVGVEFRDADGWGYCTGFLIDYLHVVTAAHCATGKPETYRIIFGLTLDSTKRVGITRTSVIYPGWTPGDHTSDIAVLRLAGATPNGYLPAQIYTRGVQQDLVTALGYGLSDWGDTSDGKLRQGGMVLGDFSMEARGVEALGYMYQSTCRGDSGGPVFLDGEVVGLLVAGDGKPCGQLADLVLLPTYKGWLEQVLQIELASKQNEASTNLLVARDKVAEAALEGWEVGCRERVRKAPVCEARPSNEDGGPLYSFYLGPPVGFVIVFESSTPVYRLAPAAIAIDGQRIQVKVTQIMCDEVRCLHMMKPTGSTTDAARALKAGNKIEFYTPRPRDFSLAGASVALSALFEAAKEADVPVPEDLD